MRNRHLSHLHRTSNIVIMKILSPIFRKKENDSLKPGIKKL